MVEKIEGGNIYAGLLKNSQSIVFKLIGGQPPKIEDVNNSIIYLLSDLDIESVKLTQKNQS